MLLSCGFRLSLSRFVRGSPNVNSSNFCGIVFHGYSGRDEMVVGRVAYVGKVVFG